MPGIFEWKSVFTSRMTIHTTFSDESLRDSLTDVTVKHVTRTASNKSHVMAKHGNPHKQ